MPLTECPECGNLDFFWDYETGETVCTICGLVIKRGGMLFHGISPPPSPWVLDLQGNMHYLVDYKDKETGLIKHIFANHGPVEIVEAKRVTPPPYAILVRIRVIATYGTSESSADPAYCTIHKRLELVKSEALGIEAEGKFKPMPLVRGYSPEQVNSFLDLLVKKQARTGRKVTIREAVIAYLYSCSRGTVSYITGFLQASFSFLLEKNLYPEFRDVAKPSVGQQLSRIARLGIFPPEVKQRMGEYKVVSIWKIVAEEAPTDPSKFRLWGHLGPTYSYVPVNRIFGEKEFILSRETVERIKKDPDWWRILD